MGSIPQANGAAVDVAVDVLVVGTGPAGGALSSFLAYHGIKGLVISRDSSTAIQPRAHYTNSAAIECLRDIGIEEEMRKAGYNKDHFKYMRFANGLAGKDLARLHSLAAYPHRLGDYETASPCTHADIPQNVAEPVFIKYATQNGFQVRFDSKFVSFETKDDGSIVSTIQDQLTGKEFRVWSKYLCGADGANSRVGRQLDLSYSNGAPGGMALNVWYKADLSHLYRGNEGLLHVSLTPEIDSPPWGVAGIQRMIRPWTEFLTVMLGTVEVDSIDIDPEQVRKRLLQFIGDPTVTDLEIKRIDSWRINDSYAHTISKGNVFCLGDAIHRHPPGNGLGSNTCIQDAYNLAWKLAYVLKGRAGPALLDTYNAERQPIGKRIVKVANDTVGLHRAMYGTLGAFLPTPEMRLEALQILEEDSERGREKRKDLRNAYAGLEDESTGLGAEMNQTYVSTSIYTDDEPGPAPAWESQDESHSVRYHTISTYPGSRLPHAWLGVDERPSKKISTHDVAGHGRFTLLTGIGGARGWRDSAKAVVDKLEGVEIKVVSIGRGQDYNDHFYMWEDRREVSEAGAVLVRPDRTVAWRSQGLIAEGRDEKLLQVMKRVLCLEA